MKNEDTNRSKLTRQEYERAIVSLFEKAEGIGRDEEEKRKLRQQELNITIDYRLGINFPKVRRGALWEVQEKIEKSRVKILVKKILIPLISNYVPQKGGEQLVAQLLQEYSKVLSVQEMNDFLGPLEKINKKNKNSC